MQWDFEVTSFQCDAVLYLIKAGKSKPLGSLVEMQYLRKANRVAYFTLYLHLSAILQSEPPDYKANVLPT